MFWLLLPINKSNVQSESFNFPGHTDFLANELEGNSLMLMISETLTSRTTNRPRSCKRCVRAILLENLIDKENQHHTSHFNSRLWNRET